MTRAHPALHQPRPPHDRMTEAVTRCARLVDQLQISPRGTASAPQHFGLDLEHAGGGASPSSRNGADKGDGEVAEG